MQSNVVRASEFFHHPHYAHTATRFALATLTRSYRYEIIAFIRNRCSTHFIQPPLFVYDSTFRAAIEPFFFTSLRVGTRNSGEICCATVALE